VALLGLVYLFLAPPSGDLAAQLYRVDLFARHGFVIWDGQWYGGHHMLDYSVLLPPLGSIVGVRVLHALSAVASTALFAMIVQRHFAPRGRSSDRAGGAAFAALWFAAGAAVTLLANRVAFDLGVAFGLGAVALAQRGRNRLSMATAAITALASPVAGAFVVLAGGAWALAHGVPQALVSTTVRRATGVLGPAASEPAPARTGWLGRSALVGGACLAAGALLALVALVLPFPEGGVEPFAASSFWPALAALLLIALVLPAQERVLRTGTLLYAAACAVAFAFPDPMGGNVVRLGTLFAGPVVAAALWQRRRLLLVAILPLLYWQCVAPVRDVLQHIGDPGVRSSYYQPLLSFLGSRRDRPFRVEIPFTLSHWEAYSVAREVPLARGWERQVDIKDNPLFYRPGLTAGAYHAWLAQMSVEYVALPDAPLDDSGRAEARLITQGLPYLHPVWHSAHWRVYRVAGAVPLAQGPGRLTELSVDRMVLQVRQPGSFLIHERFTPYWAVLSGAGCVAPTADGLTMVQAQAPGQLVLGIQFSLSRVATSAPRCSPTSPSAPVGQR
jgi:hypothetical protein